ncbi:MAG TPA: hypothetical protein VGS17_10440 [Candidatus Limnocylindria bacterium]|nr:hypothetical protein [Candidatus Limnocylindria bacterium]
MTKRKRSPLVSSVNALRSFAAGITMLSLAGMTVYAGGHLQNATAPLQPPAAAAATSAPAASSTTTSSTGRLQLSKTVPTTSTPAVTKTHHS